MDATATINESFHPKGITFDLNVRFAVTGTVECSDAPSNALHMKGEKSCEAWRVGQAKMESSLRCTKFVFMANQAKGKALQDQFFVGTHENPCRLFMLLHVKVYQGFRPKVQKELHASDTHHRRPDSKISSSVESPRLRVQGNAPSCSWRDHPMIFLKDVPVSSNLSSARYVCHIKRTVLRRTTVEQHGSRSWGGALPRRVQKVILQPCASEKPLRSAW